MAEFWSFGLRWELRFDWLRATPVWSHGLMLYAIFIPWKLRDLRSLASSSVDLPGLFHRSSHFWWRWAPRCRYFLEEHKLINYVGVVCKPSLHGWCGTTGDCCSYFCVFLSSRKSKLSTSPTPIVAHPFGPYFRGKPNSWVIFVQGNLARLSHFDWRCIPIFFIGESLMS